MEVLLLLITIKLSWLSSSSSSISLGWGERTANQKQPNSWNLSSLPLTENKDIWGRGWGSLYQWQIFLTRPRAGLRPAGPRWIVGRVQFSWVHFSRLALRLRHSALRGQKTNKTFLAWKEGRPSTSPLWTQVASSRRWCGWPKAPAAPRRMGTARTFQPFPKVSLHFRTFQMCISLRTHLNISEPKPLRTECQGGPPWAKTVTDRVPGGALPEPKPLRTECQGGPSLSQNRCGQSAKGGPPWAKTVTDRVPRGALPEPKPLRTRVPNKPLDV